MPGTMTKKRVLAVAYHFPPIQGSSGVHRILSLARYLPASGWDMTVMTVSPRAYQDHREENLRLVPLETTVIRVPALDTVRHASWKGRYLRPMAIPDRWQSWIPGGVIAGLLAVRRERPAAILSTFPIASAHVIALVLKRMTGLPWIADFRDPMYQEDYPSDPAIRRVYRWLERQVFQYADRVTVTTRGTARYYRDRYGALADGKLAIIANGYDPEIFEGAEAPGNGPVESGRLTLLHSGILYPSERDPRPFFQALAALMQEDFPALQGLRIVFRGSAYEDVYRDEIAGMGLKDVVIFEPSLPYREALTEMLAADALLVFQASNCNDQIPAKVYEYLYSRRPILAFTDAVGDTAHLLRTVGVEDIAPLDDVQAIATLLRDALPKISAGTLSVPPLPAIMMLSRKARAAEVASLLDEAVACGRSCLDNA